MSPSRKDSVRLKPWAAAAYFVLLALFGLILISWMQPNDRIVDFNAAIPGIYAHTTNLVISNVLVLGYGLLRLVTGGSLREIAIFGLIVIACNYGYELLLTLWNVKDPIDAHYGAAGVLIAVAFLALVQRFGLTRQTAPATTS